MAEPRLDHVGLAVHDLDAAAEWYCEAALSECFGHIAFDVPNLDLAFDRVVALGARPVMTPQPAPEKGVRMAYLADPEGNLVELLERP